MMVSSDVENFIRFTDVFSDNNLEMALNKIDLLNKSDFTSDREHYIQHLQNVADVTISTKKVIDLDILLAQINRFLPESDPFFPEDQITDLYEREIAADLIREAALNLLSHEVPHGIAVRIDEFKERGDICAYVRATLYVERDSHKPILVGQNGRMLKEIGMSARREIKQLPDEKCISN